MTNIAVACMSDGQLSAHFGKSTHFQIFSIEEGAVSTITTANVSKVTTELGTGRSLHQEAHDKGTAHHHDHHGHSGIIGALQGCAAVLCGGMGAGIAASLSASGITPVVVSGQYTPEEAALAYVRGSLTTGEIHACCGHRNAG